MHILHSYPVYLELRRLSAFTAAPYRRRGSSKIVLPVIVPPPAQALELRTVVGRGRQFIYYEPIITTEGTKRAGALHFLCNKRPKYE
jgi:hypothetical protein